MLRVLVLDQVVYCFVHLAANADITLIDHPYSEIIPIAHLVSVTAEVVTLTTRDALPQPTDLSGLVDVATHLRSIKEKRRVYVIPPILSLFDTTDMPD